MALSKIANASLETSDAFVYTANTTFDGVHTGITGNNLKVTSNTTVSGANTVYSGHVLFTGTVKNVGTQDGFGDISGSSLNVFTAAQRFKITNITNAGGDGFGTQTVTLNFANTNHFDIALANNITLANPSNIAGANAQGGSIFLTQDSSGSRTVTFGSYWRFPGGAAPSLSTAANAQDRIDYIVKAANTIHASVTLDLLGTA